MTKYNFKDFNYKWLFISAVLIIIILISELINSRSSRFDKKDFGGTWIFDHENDFFKLNSEELTYEFYIHGSSTHLKGEWRLIDVPFDTTNSSILVLKNDIPTTGNAMYPERSYYKYYFFLIDRIEEGKIYLTDLSAGFDFNRNLTKPLKEKS
jgi:hypothetical protein